VDQLREAELKPAHGLIRDRVTEHGGQGQDLPFFTSFEAEPDLAERGRGDAKRRTRPLTCCCAGPASANLETTSASPIHASCMNDEQTRDMSEPTDTGIVQVRDVDPATLAVLRDRARSLGQSLSGYLRDLMDADAAAETNAEVIARIARDREPVNLTMDDILAARDEGLR